MIRQRKFTGGKKTASTINHDQIWIYGKHPVLTILLKQKRKIYKILVSKNSETELKNFVNNNNLKVDSGLINIVNGEEISLKFTDQKVVHQGYAILCTKKNFIGDSEFLASIKESKEPGRILILDQLTDPHNIGAIIRSAVAFGVKNIVIPKQHFHGENATMIKSSSGVSEGANIILSGNVNNFIVHLKKLGYWVAGLAGEGSGDIGQLSQYENICLIIGSEGDGIRHLVKKNCDLLLKIPISSDVESLNASNAATIALYELDRKKQ